MLKYISMLNPKEVTRLDSEKINGIPEETVNAEETASEAVSESTDAMSDEAEQETAPESEEECAEETEAAEAEESETAQACEESADEESTEEIAEEDLCPVCGENAVAEGCDYCSGCEAVMLKRKTPFLGWLAGLAAVVMSVFALALAILVAAPSVQIARGDSLARDNCWYSAYKEYTGVSSVIDELNSILGEESPFIQTGTALDFKLIDTIANSYSPLDAISVANSLLGEDCTEKYPALKKYGEIRTDYVTAYEALMAPIEAMSYGEADAATTYAAFEAKRSAEGINGIYIDYFLYNAAVFYNEDASVKIKYLDAVDKAAKASGEDYTWLYYQDYATVLSDAGENEKALEYLEVLTEKDKTKFGAFELKMRIALANNDIDEAGRVLEEFKKYNEGYDTSYVLEASFLRVSGKLDEASALLDEALAQYDSVPELHRQQALVYLLQGDYDSAYDSAYTADNVAYYLYAYMNDTSAYTPQLNNTLYLATYLVDKYGTGTSENIAWVDDILSSFSMEELSEQTRAVINGEKTVEEVLTEGVCDLA